jgi:hypothetical protein
MTVMLNNNSGALPIDGWAWSGPELPAGPVTRP